MKIGRLSACFFAVASILAFTFSMAVPVAARGGMDLVRMDQPSPTFADETKRSYDELPTRVKEQFRFVIMPSRPLPDRPSLEDIDRAYGSPPIGEVWIIPPWDSEESSSVMYSPSSVSSSEGPDAESFDAAAATLCRLTAGFPFLDGGFIRGRGHVSCSPSRYVQLTTRLQQYRGVNFWRNKATSQSGPVQTTSLSNTPRWACAGTGSGTQTYRSRATAYHPDVGESYTANSSYARITCN